MAENTLPKSLSGLITLGQQMHAGLVALGGSLGITQITPVAFLTKLNNFINAQTTFESQRASHQVLSDDTIAADKALEEWLLQARGVLVIQLGREWSAAWAAAGFINNSTAVPRTVAARTQLAFSLRTYFQAHPDAEVASLEITADKANDFYVAATTARQALVTADVALQNAKAARDTKEEELRAMMRSLISFLDGTLGKMDTRWEQFGLQRPGAQTTPGQPQNVQAYIGPDHAIVVSCDAVPLATRYRWRIKVVGVDTAFRLAASSVPPSASISEVQPGRTVELYVQAVNGNLQGVRSETITIAVTMPSTASAPAVAIESETAPPRNGRSYSNGNGAHAPEPARV